MGQATSKKARKRKRVDIFDLSFETLFDPVNSIKQQADPLVDIYSSEQYGFKSQLARLSGLAAKDPLERQSLLDDYALNSWKILEQGEDYFVAQRNGSTVISYAPTRPDQADNAVRDLTTDALVATGTEKLGARYSELRGVTKKLYAKYPSAILTGTSLGGTMAFDIGSDLNIPSYTFNMGSGLQSALDSVFDVIFTGNATHVNYAVKTDIITSLSGLNPKLQNIWVDARSGLSAHSIENFF